MIIAVDFDGTIVSNAYPDIENFQPGAKRVLLALKKAGHTLILWTHRSKKDLKKAKNFLIDNGIVFDYYNQPDPNVKTNSVSPKIYYDVLIDDKNLGGFLGWAYVETKLL